MAVNGGHAGTKKGPNWGHVIVSIQFARFSVRWAVKSTTPRLTLPLCCSSLFLLFLEGLAWVVVTPRAPSSHQHLPGKRVIWSCGQFPNRWLLVTCGLLFAGSEGFGGRWGRSALCMFRLYFAAFSFDHLWNVFIFLFQEAWPSNLKLHGCVCRLLIRFLHGCLVKCCELCDLIAGSLFFKSWVSKIGCVIL